MNINAIPDGGINPYADHPGFTTDCRLRITVTQRSSFGGFYRGGFSCEMTGGHCVPAAECTARRERADAEDALRALCEESKLRFPKGPQ